MNLATPEGQPALLSAVTAHHQADALCGALWAAGIDGIQEVTLADGSVRLVVAGGDPATVRAVLAAHGAGPVSEVEPVEVATRSSGVTVGGRTVSIVVPPTVFGDGLHPTTATCVEMLAGLVEPGASVLDVGCGSGVLAVAAAVLGAEPVVALDISADAAAAARDNASRALAEVRVFAGTLDALHGSVFDVVVANLSAGTLAGMAEELAARAADTLVISGLLTDQVDAVLASFSHVASTVRRRVVHDGWVTLQLAPRSDRRKGGPGR